MGGFGNRPTDEQSYIVGLAGEDEAQSAGVEKTKIFIINTKGDIKYTTSKGEEKHTGLRGAGAHVRRLLPAPGAFGAEGGNGG